jgi:hypothetical protein
VTAIAPVTEAISAAAEVEAGVARLRDHNPTAHRVDFAGNHLVVLALSTALGSLRPSLYRRHRFDTLDEARAFTAASPARPVPASTRPATSLQRGSACMRF